MSEAKKEAERLKKVFRYFDGNGFNLSRELSLRCVDEKMKEVSSFKRLDFLAEVKTEIENA